MSGSKEVSPEIQTDAEAALGLDEFLAHYAPNVQERFRQAEEMCPATPEQKAAHPEMMLSMAVKIVASQVELKQEHQYLFTPKPIVHAKLKVEEQKPEIPDTIQMKADVIRVATSASIKIEVSPLTPEPVRATVDRETLPDRMSVEVEAAFSSNTDLLGNETLDTPAPISAEALELARQPLQDELTLRQTIVTEEHEPVEAHYDVSAVQQITKAPITKRVLPEAQAVLTIEPIMISKKMDKSQSLNDSFDVVVDAPESLDTKRQSIYIELEADIPKLVATETPDEIVSDYENDNTESYDQTYAYTSRALEVPAIVTDSQAVNVETDQTMTQQRSFIAEYLRPNVDTFIEGEAVFAEQPAIDVVSEILSPAREMPHHQAFVEAVAVITDEQTVQLTELVEHTQANLNDVRTMDVAPAEQIAIIEEKIKLFVEKIAEILSIEPDAELRTYIATILFDPSAIANPSLSLAIAIEQDERIGTRERKLFRQLSVPPVAVRSYEGIQLPLGMLATFYTKMQAA